MVSITIEVTILLILQDAPNVLTFAQAVVMLPEMRDGATLVRLGITGVNMRSVWLEIAKDVRLNVLLVILMMEIGAMTAKMTSQTSFWNKEQVIVSPVVQLGKDIRL